MGTRIIKGIVLILSLMISIVFISSGVFGVLNDAYYYWGFDNGTANTSHVNDTQGNNNMTILGSTIEPRGLIGNGWRTNSTAQTWFRTNKTFTVSTLHSYTYCMWVNMTQVPDEAGCIFFNRDAGGLSLSTYLQYIKSTGQLTAVQRDEFSSSISLFFPETFQTNKWYDVCIMWKNTTNSTEEPFNFTMYVNGSDVDDFTTLNKMKPSVDRFSYYGNIPTGQYCHAIYDEVAYYKRALTQDELDTRFNGGQGSQPELEVGFLDVIINDTTPNEQDDISILLNHTDQTGTPLSDSHCNITVYNTIIKKPFTNQSFYVNLNEPHFQTLSGLSTTNVISDYVYFSACHYNDIVKDQLTINLTCGGSSFKQNVNPTLYPKCSDGVGRVAVNFTDCIGQSSIIVNVTSPTRKNIQALNLERHYSSILYANLSYNASTGVYSSSTPNSFYTEGNKSIDTKCTNSLGDDYTNTELIGVTALNLIPTTNINHIFLGSYIYNYTGVLEFLNETFNFSVSISDNDIKKYNITLTNNTGTVGQSFDSRLTLSPDDLRNIANPYNLSVWAKDKGGAVSYSSILFEINDTATPICSGLTDTTVTEATTYNWNVNCIDESFYSFNISCDNGFSYFKKDIILESWNWVNSTFVNDTAVSCNYEYCDGHTQDKLKKNWYVRPTENKIEFEANNHINTLESLEDVNISYERLKDRFSFTLDFDKTKTSYDLIYTTSDSSVYVPSTKYVAWIIDYKSRTWLDLNNDGDAKVTVTKWNDTTYKIEIKDAKKTKIKFKSIGELNCVQGTQLINVTELEPEPEPVENQFTNLTNAIVYIFFYLVWLALVYVTLFTRGRTGNTIQLFNLFQVFTGIFVGFIFMGFHLWWGILTMFFACVIFVLKAIE